MTLKYRQVDVSELAEELTFALIAMFLVVTLIVPSLRDGLLARKREEWFLDALSLLNHFVVIPLIQTAILYKVYFTFFPHYKGLLTISPVMALLLTMLIDYGWYWNHRILHSRTKLWNFHMVHHAAEHLDVLATARNTFWSPLLMVYIWFISIILFLAKDPTWFLIFSSMAVMVNFWGHTKFNFKKDGIIYKFLTLFLITPHEHFWHHSKDNSYCNFATVFNFWDKLHGTWYSPSELPRELGFPIKMNYTKQAFYPFD